MFTQHAPTIESDKVPYTCGDNTTARTTPAPAFEVMAQKLPDTTIGFWPLRARPVPLNSTIAWFHSLTNRNIKRLQLHKYGVNKQKFYIVLATYDGSCFQIRLDCHARQQENHRKLPDFVITPISDVTEYNSDLWISISFSEKLKNTNIRFLISACYGTFIELDPLKSEHKSLFPLALATSIARRSLSIHERHVGSTGTALDEFWQKVSSLNHVVGRSFWQEDIADERQREVSKWIFRSARSHITSLLALPVDAPGQTLAENTVTANRQRVIAASVVAWLEFSAAKHETASITSWNRSWDTSWRKRWKRNWEASWNEANSARALSVQLENLSNISQLLPRLFATGEHGKPSGRAAGRAAIDIRKVAETATPPSQSALALESKQPMTQTGGDHATRAGGQLSVPIPDNRLDGPPSSWLESWRSTRYPNSKQKWLPAWEAASNMAWALAWEKAMEEGLQTRSDPRPSQSLGAFSPTLTSPVFSQESPLKATFSRTQDEQSDPPSPASPKENVRIPLRNSTMQSSRSSQSIAPVPIMRLAQGFIDIVASATRTSSSPDYKPPTFDSGIVTPNLAMLSDYAWKQVKSNPGSPEVDLRAQAQRALDLVKNEGNISSQMIDLVSWQPDKKAKSEPSLWEQVFMNTWEKTWKQCWEIAWVGVMDDTVKNFRQRGVEEGKMAANDVAGQPDPILDLPEDTQESFKQLSDYLAGGESLEDCYWRVRSMFKALGILHKALTHSVSTSPEEAIEICQYPEQSLIANTATTTKITKIKDPKPSRRLTHGEFQEEIKSHLRKGIKPFSRKRYELNIDLMERIWELAVKTDARDDLMDGREPEPHERADLTDDPDRSNQARKKLVAERWQRARWLVKNEKSLAQSRSQSLDAEGPVDAYPGTRSSTADMDKISEEDG